MGAVLDGMEEEEEQSFLQRERGRIGWLSVLWIALSLDDEKKVRNEGRLKLVLNGGMEWNERAVDFENPLARAVADGVKDDQ